MNTHRSRRNFLSAAAVGIGGLISANRFPVYGEERKGVWVNGMRINPAIDNLRVVNCTDPSILTEFGYQPSELEKTGFITVAPA